MLNIEKNSIFARIYELLYKKNRKAGKMEYTLFDTMEVLDSFLVRCDSSVNHIIDFSAPRKPQKCKIPRF